jgi:hypothetical protein
MIRTEAMHVRHQINMGKAINRIAERRPVIAMVDKVDRTREPGCCRCEGDDIMVVGKEINVRRKACAEIMKPKGVFAGCVCREADNGHSADGSLCADRS